MDAHTHYPEDYLRGGRRAPRRGGADARQRPAARHRRGTWSRRVALALVDHARHRRGEVPPRLREARSRSTAASPACGGARCSRRTAAGTRAGPTTRTPSWPRASAAAAGAIMCLPGDGGRATSRATASSAWPASTGATASTGPRPPGATPRACAARTCCRRASPWPLSLRWLPRGCCGCPRAAACCCTPRCWRWCRPARRGGPSPRTPPPSPPFSPRCTSRGLGFLWACLRLGPPLRAVASVARRLARAGR